MGLYKFLGLILQEIGLAELVRAPFIKGEVRWSNLASSHFITKFIEHIIFFVKHGGVGSALGGPPPYSVLLSYMTFILGVSLD